MPENRLLQPDQWFASVFQHWGTRYFATILETANAAGAELKAVITQPGDVICSMHKKRHSASVLAGDMLVTFYKPARPLRQPDPAKPASIPSAAVLGEVFDACLGDSTARFTSEALSHRIVMELWRRRALGCLNLDRREFAAGLTERGWNYDAATIVGRRLHTAPSPSASFRSLSVALELEQGRAPAQLALFLQAPHCANPAQADKQGLHASAGSGMAGAHPYAGGNPQAARCAGSQRSSKSKQFNTFSARSTET